MVLTQIKRMRFKALQSPGISPEPNAITVAPANTRAVLLASSERDLCSNTAAASRLGKVPRPKASIKNAPLSALPLNRAVNRTVYTSPARQPAPEHAERKRFRRGIRRQETPSQGLALLADCPTTAATMSPHMPAQCTPPRNPGQHGRAQNHPGDGHFIRSD